MRALDATDPARLEGALEALPRGAAVRVNGEGGEHVVHRVPGGWYLPGDVVVASGDICDGRPSSVVALGDLFGEDPYDDVPTV